MFPCSSLKPLTVNLKNPCFLAIFSKLNVLYCYPYFSNTKERPSKNLNLPPFGLPVTLYGTNEAMRSSLRSKSRSVAYHLNAITRALSNFSCAVPSVVYFLILKILEVWLS